MKTLLLAALVLGVAAAGSADAQGQWQRVHGFVQSVQGSTVTVKADDGRVLTADAAQVGESIRKGLTPGEGVTLIGTASPQPNRFTARYIQQDSSDTSRGGVVAGRAGGNAQQVLSVVPQFLASPELHGANLNVKDPATASTVVTRAYQSFFERTPSAPEVQQWQTRLVQSGDLRGMLESFINSPEYAAKGKGIDQGIVDLYQAILGRAPSRAEVDAWKQRVAQK
jgi:hypothetical protein